MTADEVFAMYSLDDAALAEPSTLTTAGVRKYSVVLYFWRRSSVRFGAMSSKEMNSLTDEINKLLSAHRKMKGGP